MEDLEKLLKPGTVFTADGVEYESKGVKIEGDYITIEAEKKEG